jgi:hypothetical protein
VVVMGSSCLKRREWFSEGIECEFVMGLIPKSAEMAVHLPPFDCSRIIVISSWRALLWRSCRSPDI